MPKVHFLPGAGKPNLPVLPAGVQKTEEAWTDDYRGTAENLVAAGILEMYQFPGQPGRGKTMASYKSDGTPIRKGGGGAREPGCKQVTRLSKTRFIVMVGIAEDEAERRRALRQSQFVDDKRAREAQEDLAETLGRMPKTADDFRQKLINYMACEGGPLWILKKAAFGGFPINNVGFTLNAKALRDLEALSARMVVLVGNGGVELDGQQRDAFIAELKQSAAAKGAAEQKPSPQLKVVWSAPANATSVH